MTKLIPYIIIGWLVSVLLIFFYAYNKGVYACKAETQRAVTKQIESNIQSNNDNLALVESLNKANINNWAKLLYPEPITIIKYIKESQVCESGKISQNTINLINEAIR